MSATKFIVDPHWKNFYTIAGLAAVLIVAAGIADTIFSMAAGEAAPNQTVPVAEWFHLWGSHLYLEQHGSFHAIHQRSICGRVGFAKIILRRSSLGSAGTGRGFDPWYVYGAELPSIRRFDHGPGAIACWVFSKKIAWFGILGFTCMLVFFTLAAFSPQPFSTAMLTSLIGGLALMIYYILIAFRLFSAQHAIRKEIIHDGENPSYLRQPLRFNCRCC